MSFAISPPLSGLLHSAWQSLDPCVLLQMTLFHFFNPASCPFGCHNKPLAWKPWCSRILFLLESSNRILSVAGHRVEQKLRWYHSDPAERYLSSISSQPTCFDPSFYQWKFIFLIVIANSLGLVGDNSSWTLEQTSGLWTMRVCQKLTNEVWVPDEGTSDVNGHPLGCRIKCAHTHTYTHPCLTLFMLKYLQVSHRQYNNIIKFKYTQYSEN